MEQRKHTEAALVLEQYAQVSPSPGETEGTMEMVRTCADLAEDRFQGVTSLFLPRVPGNRLRLPGSRGKWHRCHCY